MTPERNMSKREAFLDSVCKENMSDFLQLIQLHKEKTDPYDVEEVLQELSRDQRETLWRRLCSLLQQLLLERPPEGWEEATLVQEREAMEEEVPTDPKSTISAVEGVTLVTTVSLTALQEGDTYVALRDCAHQLHGLLPCLPVSQASLHLQIHQLCKAWWKQGLEGKEAFGRTALLLSLRKTFSLKKPGLEIQRVWELHHVLPGLDFATDHNKEVVDLLLQCYLSLGYIRHDDGKRFLVFLFSWSVDFIWMIHETIKNQLEFLNKAYTNHIAEIYFRAWKKATGVFREKMEAVCIQDLMQNAILLRRTSPVYGKVRQIVSYFHKRKGCHHVDQMLFQLYKPILWRALSAPNYEVRANATLLFTEAFAVHDPGQLSHIDVTIQKQLDTLMGLLVDPHPLVRSSATLGVCKILGTCWELIPAAVVTDFLKKLVTELASDCSSADVRCSVFKCLTIVLDNALSHPLLEKLLPALKYSLHDTSEKVRTAFLDMLIKVKAVRATKFWNVCNMDHLLARLAVDSQPVSKRIVDLLFKSFFPVNESEKEWCSRCITLIQMNPQAARKFYQYAYLHTAPTNIVKLMLVIRRVLITCLPNQDDLSQTNDGNKENSTMESMMSAQDMALVSSLLEVLVILWKSIQKALGHNKEAHQYTVAKFSSVISRFFKTFQDDRCTAPLVLLTSLMPPASVPTFSCGVLSKLKRMDSEADRAQYGQLIDCLCSWGRAADILDLVAQWLSESLPKKTGKAAANAKVRFQETTEAKPDLALAYLDYLFSRAATRDQILPLAGSSLKTIHNVLAPWNEVLYSHLSSTGMQPSGPMFQTALKAFMLCSRLAAHLHHTSESRDFLESLEHTATWVEERVLPFLSGPSAEEGPLSLARAIVEGFMAVCRDVLLVGLGDEEFKHQILHLCSLMLLSERGYLCIPELLGVLTVVMESCVPGGPEEGPEEGREEVLGVGANIFQKVVEVLARRLRKEPEEGQALCVSAAPGLSDLLQVSQSWESVSSSPLHGVFSTVFAGVVVEIRHALQKVSQEEELVVPERVDDLPPLSRLLLSVLLKTPALTRTFLAEVTSSLDSEAIDCLMGLVASLHILSVIAHTGQLKASVKTGAVSLQRQLQKHQPASTHAGDQRLMYESSVKTLNKILDS